MIHTNDSSVVALAKRAFPYYNGKKFRIEACTGDLSLASYWDGGSKDTFVILPISQDGSPIDPSIDAYAVPENHPFYKHRPNYLSILPPGYVVVKHSISCGKDIGITIYVHPDSLNHLAIESAGPVLSLFEQIVLSYTAGLKSSYGGVSNYRFVEAQRETGINANEWLAARGSLTRSGLLNKVGAITNEGRNTPIKYDTQAIRELVLVARKEQTI